MTLNQETLNLVCLEVKFRGKLSDDVRGGGGENYRRERRAARDEPDDRAARDQQGRRDYSDFGALRRTGYDATTAHWALPMHDRSSIGRSAQVSRHHRGKPDGHQQPRDAMKSGLWYFFEGSRTTGLLQPGRPRG